MAGQVDQSPFSFYRFLQSGKTISIAHSTYRHAYTNVCSYKHISLFELPKKSQNFNFLRNATIKLPKKCNHKTSYEMHAANLFFSTNNSLYSIVGNAVWLSLLFLNLSTFWFLISYFHVFLTLFTRFGHINWISASAECVAII